jgi:hypothetical protein
MPCLVNLWTVSITITLKLRENQIPMSISFLKLYMDIYHEGLQKIQLKLLIHLYDLHTNFKYLIKCDNDSGAYLFPVPFTTSKTLAAWTLTIILSDPGCNCGLFTYLDHPRSFSVLMDMFFSSLFFLKPQTELSKLWSTHYLCWRSFMFHEKQFKPWWSTIPVKRKLSYVF